MSSPELPVTPRVLRWAREASGFSAEEVATRLEQVSKRITIETIERWEEGEALPRLTALRKLAQLYKRPMAVFFLNEPPKESPPPKNFRLLAVGDARPLSPETILAVRTARRLHELAEEVSEELGHELGTDLPHVNVSSRPAELAASERRRLGASLDEQFSFQDAYKALWYWRDLLESVGCFVFQLPFPVEDARAFSEYFDEGPFIVLSTKDEPVARIFSLFHEYAHLLLRIGGICPDFTGHYLHSAEGRVEQFCNSFAGHFLVPSAALEAAVRGELEPTSERGLVGLSYRFSVSKHVIALRFLELGWVDEAFYQQKRREWAGRRPPKKRPGGPSQDVKSVSQRGRRFASLIVEAADRGLIAPPLVYEGLGVRTTYLSEIRAQLSA